MNDQQFQLFVKKGPEPGKVYVLSSVSMTIGRDPLSEITINDPEVSRRHARLIGTLSGYRIQDLGSTNGTFVDGVRLGGDPFDLQPGQIVSIGGGVELVYQASINEADQSVTMIDSDMPSLESAATEISPETFVVKEIEEQKDEPGPDRSEDDRDFETGIESFVEEAENESETEGVSESEVGDDSYPSQTVLEPQQSQVEEQQTPVKDQADSYRPDEFSEPVVIPHEGETINPPQDAEKSKFRRASTIIAALVLLIICCCCSLLIFFYYYGGDWVLRQMGLLP